MNTRYRLVAALAVLLGLFVTLTASSQDPPGEKSPTALQEAPPAAEPAPEDPVAAQEKELKRLRLAADLREQELRAELAALLAEKARLEARMALASTLETSQAAPDRARFEALKRGEQLREAALKTELGPAAAEQERLRQAQALANARLEAELAAGKEEVNRLKHARTLADARMEAELAASKEEIGRLKLAEDLLDAKHKANLAALKREQEALAAQGALAAERLKAELAALTEVQQRAELETRAAAARMAQREGQNKWEDLVDGAVPYTKEPFREGVLHVSDRRIELDGPIVTGAADYVCDRIDFFNNQDPSLPIFIVINNSPGGSVMQGYRILKAVETSRAPVHVVVKGFAASMAAAIATLAPHSYAYPNAIILHHQMSGGAVGNMTDIEQEVQTMREWERRLAEPIARKMGITLERFKERMYEAKRSGDWDEFADQAVKLKWIDHIVHEIQETGIRKRPEGRRRSPIWSFMMKRDEQGRPFMSLPPLEPFDFYFMVNPRGFYRVDGR